MKFWRALPFIVVILLLLAGIAASAVAAPVAPPAAPKISRGVLDLTGWDFKQNGNIKLDGQWEFYWDQLIPPGGFAKPGVKRTGYYPVPLYWTKYRGLRLPSRGRATYRAIIATHGAPQPLSIKTPEIYTEYNLWINGRLLDGNGSFAGRPVRYLRPDIYTFNGNAATLEIVLQIKNRAHSNAGIGQHLILGAPEQINKEHNAQAAVDIFFFTVCLIAGLYHGILFLFRKTEKELLYFVMLCIAVSIRTILSNQTWLMQFFPDLPFEIGSRLLTMTIPACAVSMQLYAWVLYKAEMPKLLFNILLAVSGLYAFAVITAPTFFYSSQFNNYLITVAVLFVVGIYCSIKGMREKPRESVIFLSGIIFLGAGACNDMLFYNELIDTGYYLSLGLTVFVILQAVALAIRYLNAYHAVEKLSKNLKASLEQVAAAKTAFLHAQIKPHFLYNALNTIADCCETNSREAGKLILSLAKYLRGTLDFENLDGIISLRKELELVTAYAAIENARFEEVRIECEIEDGLDDILLPPLTLQPLVENAIKHGIRKKPEGGTVRLKIYSAGHDVVFSVEDDGAGMAAEKAGALLSAPQVGGGIGIYNIHLRLIEKYGRGLSIESVPGRGTAVRFKIPMGSRLPCTT